MKKTLLIVSLLFLSVGVCQQKKTDEPNPMKGIKTETTSQYDFKKKFGEFKEILKTQSIFKYDSNGNMVEWSWYDSDGSLENKSIYKYDSNGNKVEWSRYVSDGTLKSKSISKYNSKNRLVEEIHYNYKLKFGELQETPTTKTIYEYEEY